MLQITFTTTLVYLPAIAFAKLSFLFFYLNLDPGQGLRTGVYLTMLVVIGSCVGIVISLLAACSPFARNFDVTVVGGRCLNKTPLYMAIGGLGPADSHGGGIAFGQVAEDHVDLALQRRIHVRCQHKW
jgi:hypothetical protein